MFCVLQRLRRIARGDANWPLQWSSPLIFSGQFSEPNGALLAGPRITLNRCYPSATMVTWREGYCDGCPGRPLNLPDGVPVVRTLTKDRAMGRSSSVHSAIRLDVRCV